MQKFDLSVWLQDKSRKVVTRDGREVRILDYNIKGDKHICIAVDDEIQESITTVDEDGHCLRDKTGWHESNFDLFFADEEEELTEFEKAVSELIQRVTNNGNVLPTKDIKGYAKTLLDLVRKELQSEHRLSEDTPYSAETEEEREAKIKSTVDYEKGLYDGYEQGKQDALKDLPKWKKCIGSTGPFIDDFRGEDYLYLKDYVVKVSELFEKLPKEE